MSQVSALVKRNTKLFFKDKGMFFTSLITPAILLMLYVTFLANVYRDRFISGPRVSHCPRICWRVWSADSSFPPFWQSPA